MGFASVQFRAQSLGKDVTYGIILPETGTGPFPVLLQLHGLSNDHTAWVQRSNLIRLVEGLPLIVVLPDGGTSGYLNWRSADRLNIHRYEDFMVIDLPDHVSRHFTVRPGPWAIGGLSMGGFGALRFGLKYPDQFASIWSHSGALHIGRVTDPTFLDDPADADIAPHAERLAASATHPVISFDCGLDDELLPFNRQCHEHFDAIRLAHTYLEYPGGHTWDYWGEHAPEALAQHARVLGIS